MMIRKGSIVKVKAVVWTAYHLMDAEKDAGSYLVHRPVSGNEQKCLWKCPVDPIVGMAIGKTHRQTGHYNEWSGDNYGQDDPPYLAPDKTHTVWLVEPLKSKWWRKPLVCLECDLEVINE